MTDAEKVDDLKEKLKDLEAKTSTWAKVKDSATILTPIILLVGGFFFQKSTASDSATLNRSLNEQRKNIDIDLENIRDARQGAAQKIEQSKLLTSLMKSMLSQEPTEKQLAISIALHACGESGRQVVAAISTAGDNDASRQLNIRREMLVKQLISPEPKERWDAAQELGTTWASDPRLITDLSDFARSKAGAKYAIYNTLVVFADLPGTTYIGNESRISEVIELSKARGITGSHTADLIASINEKLRTAQKRADLF